MIRLPLILTAAAAAAAAAVTPAVVGLIGNPSFSERLPVHVPAHASAPTFPTQLAVSAALTGEPEPGDDRRNDGRGRRADDGTGRDDRRAASPTATTLPSTEDRRGRENHHVRGEDNHTSGADNHGRGGHDPGDEDHHRGGHGGGNDG